MSNSQDKVMSCGCIIRDMAYVKRCPEHDGKSSNGEREPDLTQDEKIDLILEGMINLTNSHEELIEKLSNLSLPGDNFDVDDYES